MNKFRKYITKNKDQMINSVVTAFITTPIIVYITLMLSQPSLESDYEKNMKNNRPYLSIVGQPVIDSIVCWYDSLQLVEAFQLLNWIDSSKTLHTIIPYLRVYYRLKVVNKGSEVAVRVAETAVDTFDTEFAFRDLIFKSELIVIEPDELFPWKKLPIKDTAEIKFSQSIFREQYFRTKAHVFLQILLFYESESGVLYDTFYKYHFGFNYPKYLITSRRESFRKLDPAPLRYSTYETWKKNSSEDSKIYSYQEAKELRTRINSYYQLLRKKIELILGK